MGLPESTFVSRYFKQRFINCYAVSDLFQPTWKLFLPVTDSPKASILQILTFILLLSYVNAKVYLLKLKAASPIASFELGVRVSSQRHLQDKLPRWLVDSPSFTSSPTRSPIAWKPHIECHFLTHKFNKTGCI